MKDDSLTIRLSADYKQQLKRARALYDPRLSLSDYVLICIEIGQKQLPQVRADDTQGYVKQSKTIDTSGDW